MYSSCGANIQFISGSMHCGKQLPSLHTLL